jgi:hypothetical protein
VTTILFALISVIILALIVTLDRRITNLERKAHRETVDAWYDGYIYSVNASLDRHPRDAYGRFIGRQSTPTPK